MSIIRFNPQQYICCFGNDTFIINFLTFCHWLLECNPFPHIDFTFSNLLNFLINSSNLALCSLGFSTHTNVLTVLGPNVYFLIRA